MRMRLSLAALAVWLALHSAGWAAGPVVISEFMAVNDATLADEDGAFEDWVEILNTGPAPVNLLNWSLTDDPMQLTKWRFPATNLSAGAALIVFASGKDRSQPGAPLHANFKLSSDGEYLALVEPDGVMIAAEFAPAFPPQVADVSYGLDPGLRVNTLLAANATGKLLVPPDGALGTNWVLPAFDDSAWRTATSGVGYVAAALARIPQPGLTNGLAAYWKFDERTGLVAVESTGRASNGTLVGFPANNSQWIAGRHDGALRFRGSPSTDQVRVLNYPKATNGLTVSAWVWADGRPTWASIAKNWGGAMPGQFHFGLRDTTGDLDIFIHTSAGDFNVRESAPIPTGQWHHVAFTAEAGTLRLFRNGALVAAGTYSGNFVAPPMAALGIGVKLNDAGSAADSGAPGYWQGRIDDLAIWQRALTTNEVQAIYEAGGNYAPFIVTDLRGAMFGSNATCYLRFPFVVDNPDLFTRWRLKVRCDDGFVAWLNGEEVVRRNAPDLLEWNSAALNENPTAEAIGFDEINLAAFADVFVPGTNVLAIQGLNWSAGDTDFLLQPVLEVSSITNTTNALVYFTTPTPGAENLVGVRVLGPIIRDLAHAPAVPLDSEDLRVTARVAPAFASVTNVTLRYRVMFSNEVALTMFDDGAHGDGASGDGVYGATIPASASNPGQMVRYFVSAADALGRTNREPLFVASLDSPQYRGTVVQNLAVTSALPVIHWFVQTPGAAETDAGTRCSFFGYNGEFHDNVYVRIRGGTARSWPKKSYKIEMNEGDHFLIHPGWRRVSEFDLNATYTDKAYVRAVLTYEHQRDAGLPSSESFHVHLRQNGQFYSVAIFVEQPDRDFLRRHGMDANGALYKGGPGSTYDTTSSFEKKTRRTEDKADLQALLNGLGLSGAALEAFVFDQIDLPGQINFLATVAVTQNIDASDKNHFLYRDTLGSGEWRMLPWDLDLTFGPDALNTDTIVFNQQNTNAPACASHPYIGARPYLLHGGKYNRMIEALVKVPRAREMLLRRTRALTDEFLGTTYFQDRIEQLFTQLSPDVTADRARWGANAHFGGSTYTFRQALDRVKNEYLGPRLPYLRGTNIVGVGTAMPGRQPLNPIVALSAIEFNPASGRQPEEFIQLTNANPFPVDLSGWVLEGAVRHTFKPGTVLPSNSVLYVSPDVRAFRARTSGPRGGQGLFVQGNYEGQLSARGETLRLIDTRGRQVYMLTYPGNPTPAQLYLRITEIMYHPAPFVVPALAGDAAPGEAGTAASPEEFEYVELKNISPSVPLNLAGVRFANGIDFDFTGSAITSLAPGERVLIVKNLAAFTSRYGAARPVAGQYTGSLDNRGENLRLDDGSGEKVLDFNYDNAWYPVTDGHGFSLVIVNENAPWDSWGSRTSWRPSGAPSGSPGQTDPPLPTLAPIRVNEVLTRTVPSALDAVELFNPMSNDVNLGGWFITDDFANAFKFRIPLGTVIPAGGYLVFDENDFNPTNPPSPTGFAFSAQGDEGFLFSGDASTNLTGYVHGFAFGPAEPGVSFGRHVTSTGAEHFVRQSANTLGGVNAAPKVGPVVISEIMYHPPEVGTPGPDVPAVEDTRGRVSLPDNADDEFIELRNVSGADVPLFHPSLPGVTWRLRDAVDFDFPAAVTLGAGKSILVVSFAPTNAALVSGFRARYGAPADALILGPCQGKLDNAADCVVLLKPDETATNGTPFVLVDKVDYTDSSPWPAAADGAGASLQRVDFAAYGNDPTNWVGATPTPGAIRAAGGAAPTFQLQPTTQTVLAYTDAQFSAQAVDAGGAGPLRYQWRFDGRNLTGATGAVLSLPAVRPSQAGAYSVLAYNDAGSVESTNALLTVLIPAEIVSPPQSYAVFPFTNVAFTVYALSSSALQYQWRFNGVDIAGATSSSYSINNVQPAHDGEYSVRVTDAVGLVVSPSGRLTVLTHPVFTVPPTNRTVVIPTNNPAVTFTSLAVSSTPVRYQWRFDGVDLSGQTNSSLVLSNVQPAHTGPYTVVASDSFGSITSAPAILTVLVKPAIVAQPLDQTVVSNGTAVFTVAASGTTPLSFRWRKTGVTFTNAIIVAAPVMSALVLTNVKASDAANYTVVVTNRAGTAPISSNAVLTVLADSDLDGIPDVLEPLDGAADTDGDGLSNAAEYLAGTDWLDPNSYLKVEIANNGAAMLSFTAVSNRTYTVQYTDGLHPITWRKLADVLARADTHLETLTDPLPTTNRFYRLVTPIQP